VKAAAAEGHPMDTPRDVVRVRVSWSGRWQWYCAWAVIQGRIRVVCLYGVDDGVVVDVAEGSLDVN
jgi:hypothetical protein